MGERALEYVGGGQNAARAAKCRRTGFVDCHDVTVKEEVDD